MKVTYYACFYPRDYGNGYTIVVPDLPGCISQGADMEDAITMITKAATWWVEDELMEGREIPKSSTVEEIKPDDGGFLKMIVVDINEEVSF